MYITTANGSAPYSKKVNRAPRTVPLALVASTTVIITTTYIHAIATRYIAWSTVGRS